MKDEELTKQIVVAAEAILKHLREYRADMLRELMAWHRLPGANETGPIPMVSVQGASFHTVDLTGGVVGTIYLTSSTGRNIGYHYSGKSRDYVIDKMELELRESIVEIETKYVMAKMERGANL